MLEAMGITGIRAHVRCSQGWLDFGNSHGITQCKIHKKFHFFHFFLWYPEGLWQIDTHHGVSITRKKLDRRQFFVHVCFYWPTIKSRSNLTSCWHPKSSPLAKKGSARVSPAHPKGLKFKIQGLFEGAGSHNGRYQWAITLRFDVRHFEKWNVMVFQNTLAGSFAL